MRDFAATNEPYTCLWCGRQLRSDLDWPITAPEPLGRTFVGYGLGGEGLFCTQGCGYRFGRSFAKQGRRLRPAGEESS